MTRRTSESGFTLLEVLVASMLLAMLITILTMVFNSSSIAWSTGKAKSYAVGVWSLGPDGRENSGDDISTWPDTD